MNQTRKAGIYVHIPFCIKKCLYCDFLSFPRNHVEEYMEALVREIERTSYHREIDTIYIGGGTPSILHGRDIHRIMDALYARFSVAADVEITMEGNPGTIEKEYVREYQRAGINRFSIGLQSGNNAELAALGRIHTYEQFLTSYDIVRNCGIDNINIDVMSGIPEQTLETYERTLHQVLALEPAHISAYSLIVESGTAFAHMQQEGMLNLADEEEERRMYERTRVLLQECGFKRYEISNYSIPGRESRHNIKYWTGNEYVGLGLGASSLIDQRRYHNTTDIKAYIRDAGEKEIREDIQFLSKKDQIEEFMFLGLRMTQGIRAEEFYERFHVSLEKVYGSTIKSLESQGLLQYDESRLVLTEFGISVSNRVLAEFLLDILD